MFWGVALALAVWLAVDHEVDELLDDTLHDATNAAMRQLTQAMSEYMVRELQITPAESDALRRRYWQRYGATLLGLVRHHGVKPAHFLHDTHLLPGLEQRVRGQQLLVEVDNADNGENVE